MAEAKLQGLRIGVAGERMPFVGFMWQLIYGGTTADNPHMGVAVEETPPVQAPRTVCVRQLEGRLATLEFTDESRPAWFSAEFPMRVPLPPGAPLSLPAERVLLWGYLESGERLPLAVAGPNGLALAYEWTRWSAYIRLERYATWRRRPLHTRFPVSYRTVPAQIRHLLAGRMCRVREKEHAPFPSLPFDGGFEALREIVARNSGSARSVELSSRVCLTHDVDTADGFRFVRDIARVEAELGVRSCWNIVPYGYRVDDSLCTWLIEQGHEIGWHGHCHDNRLIYLPESDLRRRLNACVSFKSRYAVRGFRSPSWLRNIRLMRVLADYVDYDTSCLDFDGVSPAGRGGVLTASPFRMGSLIELPTTLPFDVPILFGYGPDGIVRYWDSKIRWLAAVRGQAVVNAHPDPHYVGNVPMIRAYARFLEGLLNAFGGRWSLPRQLADEVRLHA